MVVDRERKRKREGERIMIGNDKKKNVCFMEIVTSAIVRFTNANDGVFDDVSLIARLVDNVLEVAVSKS